MFLVFFGVIQDLQLVRGFPWPKGCGVKELTVQWKK